MIAVIKAKAHKLGIIEMKGGLKDLDGGCYRTVMTVYPKANIDPEAVKMLLSEYGGALRMRMDANPAFIWQVTKKKFTNARDYLSGLNNLMDVFMGKLLVKNK